MTTQEVVNTFMQGGVASNSRGSLTSTGDKLVSYQTCIVQYDKNSNLYYVNNTRYSPTTSRQHNMVWELLKDDILKNNIRCIFMDKVPKKTIDLIDWYLYTKNNENRTK